MHRAYNNNCPRNADPRNESCSCDRDFEDSTEQARRQRGGFCPAEVSEFNSRVSADDQGEVFRIREADGYRVRFGGVIASASWQDKGAAEAQLSLLRKGYSFICSDGRILHTAGLPAQEVSNA